uniref:nucleoporin SEH1-like n=1 Tax=Ciona intestinalis TaxID=7719 RepID=UPI000521A7B3|nr:nucleoporin SEH1-like [Ciona intestinalis]|eukprot:XP_002132055.2 nucleoporin SEH1-like [Ciona intestinalis]
MDSTKDYLAKKLNSDHQDLIHDISFDLFGKRFATCSSDQCVQVWDLDENGDWQKTACWKTHSGSVWKVTWAHPQFGQVLATCSFDKTACIWEERVVENASNKVEHIWVNKANLVDSRSFVKDVKFAPKHLGLQLATCSEKGVVRIYEAPDEMNLTQWSMQDQVECKISCSCISWNPSTYRYHSPMIAVGSDDSNSSSGGKVFILQYNDTVRDWIKISTIMIITDPVSDVSFAPNPALKYHRLAVASKDLHIFHLKPMNEDNDPNYDIQNTSYEHNLQEVAVLPDHRCEVTGLSWNETGTGLISAGVDGQIFLWKANYLGIWKKIGSLKGEIASPAEPQTFPQNNSLTAVAINNRINFRRFTQGRPPPPVRPLAPKFAGAYY